MAQVVYLRNAASNVERLHRFLAENNPDAAARAAGTILDRLVVLARFPRLDPVDPDRPDTRQLSNARSAMKKKYGGEMFPAGSPAAPSKTFREFFQQDREGRPKGIVRIDPRGV